MRHFLLGICVLCFISPLFALEETVDTNSESSDEVDQYANYVKQGVLIMDLVNIANNQDYDYLSDTIPNSIEIALMNTEKFRMISRDNFSEFLEEQKVNRNELYNEGKAVDLAKTKDADVAVIGTFEISGEDIRIIVKAIRVETGEIPVARNFTGVVGVDLFSTIDEIATKLALDMQKVFPPEPPEIRIQTFKYTFILPEEFAARNPQTVHISGDFNKKVPDPMIKNPETGYWEYTTEINPTWGEYKYKFILDGEEVEETIRSKFKIQDGKLKLDQNLFHPRLSLIAGFPHPNAQGDNLSNRLNPAMAVLSFRYAMTMHFVSKYLFAFLEAGYFGYQPRDGYRNPVIEDYDVSFHNIPILLGAGFQFRMPFHKPLSVIPILGAGTTIQINTIEGDTLDSNLTETSVLFTAKAGVNIDYKINDMLNVFGEASVLPQLTALTTDSKDFIWLWMYSLGVTIVFE